MINLSHLISLPIITGLVVWLLPGSMRRIKGSLSLIASIIIAYWSYRIYLQPPAELMLLTPVIPGIGNLLSAFDPYLHFRIDPLAQLIVLLTGIFGLLLSIYTWQDKEPRHFHALFLITLGLTFGAILACNLLLFLFFWGVLGITLYLLIPGSDPDSAAAAKKTLIMIGSSDGIMILGLGLIYKLTGSFSMTGSQIDTHIGLGALAFLALLAGSFTKAGAFPFHSWIPDYTRQAPAASSAFLPASLDKLLGIYFLVRICSDLFAISPALRFIMLGLGAITILAAVMMALVQHDYKKLLGFHAVSQVGYMVLGIALGTALGVAAGIFHMINNALYKSGLFLSAGNLAKRTGQENLDALGGLSRRMPITFACACVFALSISGIPPFNGFASKWMIYQAIIDTGSGPELFNRLWILWLGVAVLGSALTLASFIKFIAGAFLGDLKPAWRDVKEASFMHLFPLVLLALGCMGLGIFATSWVATTLLVPLTGTVAFIGTWPSTLVSMLILISILAGLLLYFLSNTRKYRRSEAFTGGEAYLADRGFPVTHFYGTIRNAPVIRNIYEWAYKGWFDVYHLLKSAILWVYKIISLRHDGILQTYLQWAVAGLILLLLILKYV